MKKYLLGFLVGVFATASSTSIMAAVESYNLTKYETPVYIQGVKYPTDALPVLSLDANGGGNTYVPLRNFSEMMGATVAFDSATNRINITMPTTTANGGTNGTATGNGTGNTATINSNNNANSNNSSWNNGKTTGNSNKDKDKNKGNTTTGTTTTDGNTQASGGGTNTSTSTESSTVSKTFNSTYNLNVYTFNGVTYVETDEIEEFYFDDDYKAENDELDFEDSGFTTKGTITLENNDTVVVDGIKATKMGDDYYVEFDYFVSTIYPAIK